MFFVFLPDAKSNFSMFPSFSYGFRMFVPFSYGFSMVFQPGLPEGSRTHGPEEERLRHVETTMEHMETKAQLPWHLAMFKYMVT